MAIAITLIIVNVLLLVFALCVGYKLGQDKFFRDCKEKDYVVYTKENFEAIKEHEREQGRKRAYRDYIERGLKEEYND